jgi:NAD(P)-dependent dehydrogenase (short-subunit alcohol dehydrogenase family)
MVALNDVLASNAALTAETVPQVAVFHGGTAGIGNYTLQALASTGLPTRIYMLGRPSAHTAMQAQITTLRTINPKAELIWLETDISLLASVQQAITTITTTESHIDLLFMTAGYAPFGPRQETSEGIEVSTALSYYSRILLTLDLLPLLEASPGGRGRVVTVNGGGLETPHLDVEDIDMHKPGAFNGMKAQMRFVRLMTATFDKLAQEHADVVFVHAYPGAVNTGNAYRDNASPWSLWGWLRWAIVTPLFWLLGLSEEEAGQRYLFLSTSAMFGGAGVGCTGAVEEGVNTLGVKGKGGVFLVGRKQDCTPNMKNVALLRQIAREKVWGHTLKMLKPYRQTQS